MVNSYESVLSLNPFVVSRRVRWSECDPAGVVYTGKFTDYMLGVVNLFYANLGGVGLRTLLKDSGVSVPCRGMELDFVDALWPEDEFLMRLNVTLLGNSTFELRIVAERNDGKVVFRGRFTGICIPSETPRRRVSMPPVLREALSSFLYKDI